MTARPRSARTPISRPEAAFLRLETPFFCFSTRAGVEREHYVSNPMPSAKAPTPSVIPAKAGIQSDDLSKQVSPIRVRFFDQHDLPLTIPSLQLFFAPDSSGHIAVELVVDELVHVVPFRKSAEEIAFVLPHSFPQVAGYTDIKCTEWPAPENVDGRLLGRSHRRVLRLSPEFDHVAK